MELTKGWLEYSEGVVNSTSEKSNVIVIDKLFRRSSDGVVVLWDGQRSPMFR